MWALYFTIGRITNFENPILKPNSRGKPLNLTKGIIAGD